MVLFSRWESSRKDTFMKNIMILGASKGLGQEITEHFISNGDRTIELARSVQDGESGNRKFIHCDLGSDKSVANAIEMIKSDLNIDRFFWVAGQMLKGEFSEHAASEITNHIDVNFRNSVLIAHVVWNQMCRSNSEKTFTVISSSSGVKAKPNEAIYVATKHAQVGFTRSLGLENKNKNLKVSLFLPGGMQTPFWNDLKDVNTDDFLDPKKVAQLICSAVINQNDMYLEKEIPRNSRM